MSSRLMRMDDNMRYVQSEIEIPHKDKQLLIAKAVECAHGLDVSAFFEDAHYAVSECCLERLVSRRSRRAQKHEWAVNKSSFMR